ncbi:MAG: cardiolipin synthase [Desulfobacteraceae bacterium]|nr:MAG: cardiolipin synthase [Desulfobacteraceae bacterium]
MASHLDTLFLVALYTSIAVMVIYLLLENKEAGTTLSWLLVFFFIPIVGLILYFLFGKGMRKKQKETLARQNLEHRLQYQYSSLLDQQVTETQVLHERYTSPESGKLIRLLQSNSDSILTRHNSVKLFFSGRHKFDVLIEDLEAAQHYIHMEYFIWRRDELTRKIVEILKKKAAQGVKVRILYDEIGNFLPRRYRRKLRKAGIEIHPNYHFLSLFRIHILNYRNHRKLVIIDGHIGYLGGMNMGQEYINGGRYFPFWRDTHARIQGESVAVLQEVFAVGWFNTIKEDIEKASPIPEIPKRANGTHIQITTSGPDSEWDSIKQIYFQLISTAEKHIYIISPYFIPDASIVMALKTAALSGIDVRVLLTGYLDKRVPYWAALTYLKDLLSAGVRFFYYTKGFMHAKTLVVDSHTCSIGTANMDIRSFALNYEINALIYDQGIAKEVEEMFFTDLQTSREFTLKDYDSIRRLKQLRNSLARLFAPLL